MTEDDKRLIAEMEAGLANVTPGPWAVNPFNAVIDAFNEGFPIPVCKMLWPTDLRSEDETQANSAHLVRCSPDNIRTLLSLIRSAEERAEKAEADAQQWLDAFDNNAVAAAKAVVKTFDLEEKLTSAEADIAKLRETVQRIHKRARSDGNRTFDEAIRDLSWIDDECRLAALSEPSHE